MNRKNLLISIILFNFSSISLAYTANKVWFEFLNTGRYRVWVNYTVPELKEFREAYSEFSNRKQAEKYYWDLVRGADFTYPTVETVSFAGEPPEPSPW